MTLTIRVPALRSLAFVAVGVILGATLMAPVLAQGTGAAAVIATTYTRSVSCAGLDFYPVDDAPFSHSGSLRTWGRNVPSGSSGYFLCDPGLPNGAVVTKVQFTLRDGVPDAQVDNCALVRSGLTVSTAASVQVLASVAATGIGTAPGTVRLVDDTIDYPTINNKNYGYWLQCRIYGVIDLGIYGANVIYTISSTKG